MELVLALAGDAMLGRGVGRRIARSATVETFCAPEVRQVLAEADLVLLNLECCVSDRGERWPDPSKPYFFRAPPAAAGLLAELGVDCVTLANNHALDFGYDALATPARCWNAPGCARSGPGPPSDGRGRSRCSRPRTSASPSSA